MYNIQLSKYRPTVDTLLLLATTGFRGLSAMLAAQKFSLTVFLKAYHQR